MDRVRWQQVGQWVLAVIVLAGVGCRSIPGDLPPRTFNVYQDWALEPGDRLAGYEVHSGLGDVAIDLGGNPLYMPFNGQVQRAAGQEDRCLVVSSPDVPAYLFRLCGVTQERTGNHRTGEVIGRGSIVAFATMRRQADGTWAMVEPAKDFLAQFLNEP
ncbi:MAG: hypothetical protein VKI82_05895 [Leptolyngbya sp.]|nr:hypothetical protein [Leptolyngbya sp.]